MLGQLLKIGAILQIARLMLRALALREIEIPNLEELKMRQSAISMCNQWAAIEEEVILTNMHFHHPNTEPTVCQKATTLHNLTKALHK